MFLFVTRYLGFLKFVPGFALIFDTWLKFYSALTKPYLLDYIDQIEGEVLTWKNTTATQHKYGGLQLNYHGKEIGHIHSNGLMDMLLNRSLKQQLLIDGRIQDHHILKKSGWISFYLHNDNDRDYALKLLKINYDKLSNKASLAPSSDHQTA